MWWATKLYRFTYRWPVSAVRFYDPICVDDEPRLFSLGVASLLEALEEYEAKRHPNPSITDTFGTDDEYAEIKNVKISRNRWLMRWRY